MPIIRSVMSLVFAGLLAHAAAGAARAQSGNALEKSISISDVPRIVFDAARKALRIAPTEAVVKIDNGKPLYELRGTNVYFKRISVGLAMSDFA